MPFRRKKLRTHDPHTHTPSYKIRIMSTLAAQLVDRIGQFACHWLCLRGSANSCIYIHVNANRHNETCNCQFSDTIILATLSLIVAANLPNIGFILFFSFSFIHFYKHTISCSVVTLASVRRFRVDRFFPSAYTVCAFFEFTATIC